MVRLDSLKDIIVCPSCRGNVKKKEDRFICNSCDKSYNISESQVDFRLDEPLTKTLEYTVNGASKFSYSQFIEMNKKYNPEFELENIEPSKRLSETLLSHFPEASSSTGRMLDLGCGDGIHRESVERIGFDWVGVDIDSRAAPVLADGHVLPFADNSFDFVLSINALEHMENPFLMLKEVRRVIKSNKKFIGTVAFLEPYHDRSYYHMSPLGVLNSLDDAGFEIEEIGTGWSGIRGQIRMGLFPKIPRIAEDLFVSSVKTLHKIWYTVGRRFNKGKEVKENYRRFRLAGSFMFVAHS